MSGKRPERHRGRPAVMGGLQERLVDELQAEDQTDFGRV